MNRKNTAATDGLIGAVQGVVHIEGLAKGSDLPSAIFGFERVELRGAGGNCMTRNFMICTLHQMLDLSCQEDLTGGACGSHRKEQKRVNIYDTVT